MQPLGRPVQRLDTRFKEAALAGWVTLQCCCAGQSARGGALFCRVAPGPACTLVHASAHNPISLLPALHSGLAVPPISFPGSEQFTFESKAMHPVSRDAVQAPCARAARSGVSVHMGFGTLAPASAASTPHWFPVACT